MKTVRINLHRRGLAHDFLEELVEGWEIGLYLLSEPTKTITRTKSIIIMNDERVAPFSRKYQNTLLDLTGGFVLNLVQSSKVAC